MVHWLEHQSNTFFKIIYFLLYVHTFLILWCDIRKNIPINIVTFISVAFPGPTQIVWQHQQKHTIQLMDTFLSLSLYWTCVYVCVCVRVRERERKIYTERGFSLCCIKAQNRLLAGLNKSCWIMWDSGAWVHSLILIHEIRVTDNVFLYCKSRSRPSCMIPWTWTVSEEFVKSISVSSLFVIHCWNALEVDWFSMFFSSTEFDYIFEQCRTN